MTVNLGLNSASIKYEVALEILGQERAPLMDAIRREQAKAIPCVALIRFYETRLSALGELQDALRTSDLDAIEQVLDKGNRLIRT